MNILIIDDQLESCYSLKSKLSKLLEGGSIDIEINALNVNALVRSKKYDLVFLDIDMPLINGFDTFKEIREVESELPIVFATGHPEHVIEALRISATDYLIKPVLEIDLKECLERLKFKNLSAKTKLLEDFKNIELTEREIDIAFEMLKGLSSLQIGQNLFISKHTVDTHRRHILYKSGCISTAEFISKFG